MSREQFPVRLIELRVISNGSHTEDGVGPKKLSVVSWWAERAYQGRGVSLSCASKLVLKPCYRFWLASATMILDSSQTVLDNEEFEILWNFSRLWQEAPHKLWWTYTSLPANERFL